MVCQGATWGGVGCGPPEDRVPGRAGSPGIRREAADEQGTKQASRHRSFKRKESEEGKEVRRERRKGGSKKKEEKQRIKGAPIHVHCSEGPQRGMPVFTRDLG